MNTVYVGGEAHVLSFSFEHGAFLHKQTLDVGRVPSFLCFAPGLERAYAAVEDESGAAALELDADGRLRQLSTTACPGGPAYISVDASCRWVFTASYGSGELRLFEVRPDSTLRERQVLSTGKFSHAATFGHDGRRLYVPVKGEDKVVELDFDPAQGQLHVRAELLCPQGSGPRHIALKKDGSRAYVVGENDCTLLVFARLDDNYQLVQTLSTLPRAFAAGDSGADVHLSPDEQHLVVSNRGHDSLTTFTCAPEALRFLANTPSGGRVPRNFCFLDDELLLVANQESHDLALFSRQTETGVLSLLVTHPVGERCFWVGPARPEQARAESPT